MLGQIGSPLNEQNGTQTHTPENLAFKLRTGSIKQNMSTIEYKIRNTRQTRYMIVMLSVIGKKNIFTLCILSNLKYEIDQDVDLPN